MVFRVKSNCGVRFRMGISLLNELGALLVDYSLCGLSQRDVCFRDAGWQILLPSDRATLTVFPVSSLHAKLTGS